MFVAIEKTSDPALSTPCAIFLLDLTLSTNGWPATHPQIFIKHDTKIDNEFTQIIMQHSGSTPLMQATYKGCKEMVLLLIERGADLDAQDKVREL